jgi:hypothetical protein
MKHTSQQRVVRAKKALSRQRKWQIARVKQGLCEKCGKPRNHFAFLCDACRAYRTRWERGRYAEHRAPVMLHEQKINEIIVYLSPLGTRAEPRPVDLLKY